MSDQTTSSATEQDRVKIFDTTMRDGEQSPGASMTLDEKIQIGSLLDEMGVDIIEAGFPIASEGDFEAVREVARIVENASVCGLARAAFGDIERAAAALEVAKKPRIHTFIGTSPLHRKYQLDMNEEQVLEKIDATVRRARALCDDVQWSPMDATRTEPEYLVKVVDCAIKAGASTINIPDTVGYAVPGESAEIIAMLLEQVEGARGVTFSTHCHNDLGMATANSLAAVLAGARQVECTINGLGERAGNAALEEIVMALKVRNDRMPYQTGVISQHLMRASRLVSSVTGFAVQYNKAIVGQNAFAHESGIHQDGVLKNAETFEIMKPEDVGLSATNLVMGKHSGRHALKDKLKNLGFEVGDNQLNDVFVRFKALADRKKEIYDEDIVALMDDATTSAGHDRIKVKFLRVICGTEEPQSADLILEIDGVDHQKTANGDGPVDAAFNAIKALVPHAARLKLYQVSAVTQGTDAQAEVFVRLEEDGRIVTGQAANTDTLVASARAYVNALNKLLVRRGKSALTTDLDGAISA
ncbi:MAG: 2-isopropylmalate synthase [Neomegalonema sp.]|nr:2-isopropylmalate synthase [Neomegalonema sp.]